MRTKIEVTKQCIKRGIKTEPGACAITLAVYNVVNPEYTILTDGEYVDILDGACLIELPKKAKEFALKFDERKKSVAPISFVIDIPKKYLKPELLK